MTTRARRPTVTTQAMGETIVKPSEIDDYLEGSDIYESLKRGRTVVLDGAGFIIDIYDGDGLHYDILGNLLPPNFAPFPFMPDWDTRWRHRIMIFGRTIPTHQGGKQDMGGYGTDIPISVMGLAELKQSALAIAAIHTQTADSTATLVAINNMIAALEGGGGGGVTALTAGSNITLDPVDGIGTVEVAASSPDHTTIVNKEIDGIINHADGSITEGKLSTELALKVNSGLSGGFVPRLMLQETVATPMTSDSEFHIADLSSVVPEGAVAVLLKVAIYPSATGEEMIVYTDSILNEQYSVLLSGVPTQASELMHVLPLKPDRCLQYVGTVGMTCSYLVIGWFI